MHEADVYTCLHVFLGGAFVFVRFGGNHVVVE